MIEFGWSLRETESERDRQRQRNRERERLTFCDPEVGPSQCMFDNVRSDRAHPPLEKFA